MSKRLGLGFWLAIGLSMISMNLFCATPTNPVKAEAVVVFPIVADATYHVKTMNINFTQLSYLNTDASNLNVSYLANSAASNLGYAEPKYMEILGQVWNGNFAGIVGAAQWYIATQAIAGALNGLANSLASYNTQYRYFTFYIPVDGRYVISVALPGDPVIKPKSSLQVVSGAFNWSWNEQLSSHSSKSFVFEKLAAGPYIAVVSLGSTSTIFHTAGDLTQVRLESYSEKIWTNKVIIKSDGFDVRTQLPAIGSTKQYSFSFLPIPANTNIIDGRVDYSNFEAKLSFLNVTYNNIWTKKVGGLCRWVEFPNASENKSPFILVGQAFYSIQRGANDYEKVCGEQ